MIGGLCLAQGLVRDGIEVTVYERDGALDSRGQGYRLHLDAGRALRACLPPDLYELVIATSGRPSTELTVVSRRLRQLRQISFETATGTPGQPGSASLSTSVNRQAFREILAARLGGVLEFGRACVGFSQSGSSVQIRFGDGPVAPEYTWRGFTAVAGSGVGMATGVLDFRAAPEEAAARISPAGWVSRRAGTCRLGQAIAEYEREMTSAAWG